MSEERPRRLCSRAATSQTAVRRPAVRRPAAAPPPRRPRRICSTARSTSTASSPGWSSTIGCLQLAEDELAAAARAAEVPRDLRRQPRRVLHDPRRRGPRPGRRADRRPRPGRAGADRRCSSRSLSGSEQLDRRHSRVMVGRDPARSSPRDGIRITSCEESGAPASAIERHFREQIFPVLTPLAVGPGRPFPYISNLSLSLLVRLHDPDLDHEAFARVKVPKGGPAAVRRDLARTRSSRSRTSSPATSTRCSRAWTSSATTCSASRATPTSRSPTRPTTCSKRSRTSSAGGASARSCGSRSAPAWIPGCAPG